MTFLDLLRERSVIFDGATGSNLQLLDLGEDDFAGKEGCNEVLCRSRPDLIRALHDSFLAVGSHVVETNSFGGSRVVLAEYGLEAEAYQLNRRAAELAREVASGWNRPDRPRFVAGSIGPGTKLPSLGQIDFDALVLAYREQAAGLIDGGVDLLVVETCQDILQTRAALYAIRRQLERLGHGLPILVSLTIELTGSMLLGTDLQAALATLLPLRPDILGLNCATGPLEMKQHLGALARSCPFPLAAQPNAGLPENRGGKPFYALTPEEFARWHESFILEDGVQIVGGCCGTTPQHIAALCERVDSLTPARRTPRSEPSLTSLYSALPLAQEPRPFLVGERTNANGSKRFRELLLAERYDDLVELARDQERGGAHALDLCTAYVGRDESRDMREAVTRFVRQVRLPLVIDSTQSEVMEEALKRIGGRSLLNSLNLEDGEAKARTLLGLARDFGAAVVALVIDESGMARTVEHKLAVAERIFELATREFGLAPADLVFDMLTFTVGSGDETLRDSALQTLGAIRELKARHPEVYTILGVSNVSFGLKPAARRVLNSVFLSLAVEHGLDLAIVDASKILPLNRIDPTARALAEDLLHNRRAGGDPVFAYLQHFESGAEVSAETRAAADARPLGERIQRKVVDGDRAELELLLASELTRRGPLAIINELLIPAMKEVGELFGAGQMQLPFVLQSAEVMKQAVAFLEPHLERGEALAPRGTLVLATVKGDVHDIGKNLVDILLSNNGFRILNLGIKVPIEEMIRVYQAEHADAIGMSGLLVKSTLVMKQNLEELLRRELHPTVLLGGAALTRRYVEEDLRAIYGAAVHYGKDAFEGLDLMRAVKEGALAPSAAAGERAPGNLTRQLRSADAEPSEEETSFYHAPQGISACDPPSAPFFGSRVLEIGLEEVFPLLNETTLFRGQWQYRRGKLDAESYAKLIEGEVRPAFERLKREVLAEGLFRPRAVYGYLPCFAEPEQNQLVLLDPDGSREVARFRFPRQRKPPYHSIADFFRRAGEGPDLLGIFVVTIGAEATRRSAELFASHRYRDYLHLHGLAVECAEASAEQVHRVIRRELAIAGEDAAVPEGFFRQEYRGSRYSFGYPACPDLEQQRTLFELLAPERIGVSLTENAQMEPEQSVSAFVVHHPAAKYFTT